MKKSALNLFAILTLAIAFVGCKKTEEAKTGEAQKVTDVAEATKYKAVKGESAIHWKANKIVGGHEGTISVSNGMANLKDGKLIGGNFVFDINTIACTDIPADNEDNAKLVNHLKGDDFFDVANHSSAVFEITKIDGDKVSGNLTIKGIKKNITFPAKVTVTGDDVSITSDVFTIDRTEWNIKYNSGKFADPAKLGDYLIKDDVELKIAVKAKKA